MSLASSPPQTHALFPIAPRSPQRPGHLLAGLWLLGALLTFGLGPAAAQVEPPTLTIGTASPSGVYYRTGRAICRVIEVPCLAVGTGGSVANLEAVREGRLPMALAQSDAQYRAVKGLEEFAGAGPDTDLRSVFSLHSEPFTLVVRRRAGIDRFQDLPGHAINLGNPGSGQRGTMEVVMDTVGWTRSDFAQASGLPADQQAFELCHGNIEAMVYTVGHPNRSVGNAIRLCDARIIGVEGDVIEALLAAHPYYSRATIPAGLYGPDQPAIATFGVRATLIASRDTDPGLVYDTVKAVFEHLPRFKDHHPAFAELTPTLMIQEGLSAPLHEGALRYYREQGWLD
ncbi:TAXI family TRAP transporter solute-binding subunit [Halomonas sp. YLGW01]|uniref:TAXI family TRAP transporter solute-binding subunit n=1 Tax=Halomonas sp. YLGW01 TaxID=2773308 RepID=UPI00178159A2|nr:TAXI family TRAP transporter solute-binding subunit [Halomonas sp. YLGW01]